MAQQTINTGTSENKGDGDPLRTAFTKANTNFTELYNKTTTLSSSGALTYTATTSSDWNGTAPTTVEAAIDRLAALVKTLNSGTGA